MPESKKQIESADNGQNTHGFIKIQKSKQRKTKR